MTPEDKAELIEAFRDAQSKSSTWKTWVGVGGALIAALVMAGTLADCLVATDSEVHTEYRAIRAEHAADMAQVAEAISDGNVTDKLLIERVQQQEKRLDKFEQRLESRRRR